MGRIWKRAVLSLLMLTLAGSLFLLKAQNNTPQHPDTTPVFRSQARLVIVDVTVTDEKGEPVTDLTANDFVLTEDGKEQKVLSFESHGAPDSSQAQLEAAELPPNVFSNVPVGAKLPGPVNVILFDVLNTSPQSSGYAREQMLKFVESLPRNQHIALFFLGKRLSMVQGPTGRTDELIEAAKRLLYEKVPLQSTEAETQDSLNSMNYAAGVAAASMGIKDLRVAFRMRRVVKTEEAFQRRNRVAMTADAMKHLALSLAGYRGRKNIIWLTESFPLSTGPDPEASELREDPLRNSDNFLNEVHHLGTLLANQQVAIYPIDVGGMRVQGRDAKLNVTEQEEPWSPAPAREGGALYRQFATEESSRATMINVADETGGRAFYRTNDLALAAQKALVAGSTYYTLTYTPTSNRWKGQYRHINVETSKRDLRLEYRRGYYAFPEPQNVKPDDSRKLLMEAMLPGRVPYTSLLFKAQVVPDPNDKSRIVIQYAIDPQSVTFTDTSDGRKQMALDFFAVASTPNDQDAGHAADSLEPALKPETYASIQRSGIPASQELRLKPGEYSLRLGMIDRNTQRIGTVVVPLKVNP